MQHLSSCCRVGGRSLSRRSVMLSLPTAGARQSVRYASANTKETGELVNPTPVAAPSTTTTAKKAAKSSCPAGTVLKGLGFHANKPDPVALPDDEYPAWLWRLLDKTDAAASSSSDQKGSSSSSRPSATSRGFRAQVTIKGQKTTIDKSELRKKNRENIKNDNFLRAQ